MHPIKIQKLKDDLPQIDVLIEQYQDKIDDLKDRKSDIKSQIKDVENEVETEVSVEAEEAESEALAAPEPVEEEEASDLEEEAVEEEPVLEEEEAVEEEDDLLKAARELGMGTPESPTVDYSALSRDELKAAATEKGIDFKGNASNKKLVQLLEDA